VAVALVTLLLGVAGPPRAPVSVGATRVPLAISSWCWRSRCGAPIAASKRTATVRRGTTVSVVFTFAPTRARVAVDGVPQRALTSGKRVSWRATKAGGITVSVTARPGWITYVGRLAVRR
jgi:hypothetical protein